MVLRYAHVNVAHTAPSITAMPSIGPAKAKPGKAAPAKKGKRRSPAVLEWSAKSDPAPGGVCFRRFTLFRAAVT